MGLFSFILDDSLEWRNLECGWGIGGRVVSFTFSIVVGGSIKRGGVAGFVLVSLER